MSDTQLLRDIVSELKKISKKLDDLNSTAENVERAAWESVPEK